MFVMPISNTQNTAPVSIHNASRVLDPTACTLKGTTLTPRFCSDAPRPSSSRRAIALNSS